LIISINDELDLGVLEVCVFLLQTLYQKMVLLRFTIITIIIVVIYTQQGVAVVVVLRNYSASANAYLSHSESKSKFLVTRERNLFPVSEAPFRLYAWRYRGSSNQSQIYTSSETGTSV
jgi:hypothetical protein